MNSIEHIDFAALDIDAHLDSRDESAFDALWQEANALIEQHKKQLPSPTCQALEEQNSEF